MPLGTVRLVLLCLHTAIAVVPAGFACLTVTSSARAADVTNAVELLAAIDEASGGETIILAPGDYGEIVLLGDRMSLDFPHPVRLVSENPSSPATFTGLDVRKARNLVFDTLRFDYRFQPGEPIHKRPFFFVDCENITIRNSVFDGDVARGRSTADDGYATGIGLTLRTSRGSTVEDNTFSSFFRGLTMGSGFDATIRGNRFRELRMDGMNFAQMQGIRIEGNLLYDFRRSPTKSDHADMIQFWTNGTEAPSTDIVIRDNVLISGSGGSTQSIFLRNDLVDRGLAGEAMFFRNVIIEDNVIINGHTHGITLGAARNVLVRNNTLMRSSSAAKGADRTRNTRIPRIRVSELAQEVTITGNLAAAFPAAQAGWRVSDNLVIQDLSPSQPGYYDDLFRDAIHGDPRQLENYVYRSDGEAVKRHLGAALLKPESDRNRFRLPQ